MASTNENFLCPSCFQKRTDLTGACPVCGYDPAENLEKYPIALRPGSILNGKYVVGRVLGQGGFGITYLAWDDMLEIKVAIKEFLPEGMANRTPGTPDVTVYSGAQGEQFRYGMESFLEEARVLAKFIGHSNIVGVRSYFQENGTAYLVMEYVEGSSFKQYIADQGGRVGWEDALRVLRPVMEALSAVHKAGILHRDVTPDNIYLTKDGGVKLLDFGAARYNLGDKSHSLDVILKAGYAPKEQYIRKGKQGPYTDVYSVAATLYASISGYLPPESLERIDEDDLIPISNRGIRIPEQLEDAILKGLEMNPRDRFQSMDEFLAAIGDVVVRETVPPVPPVPPVPLVKEEETTETVTVKGATTGTATVTVEKTEEKAEEKAETSDDTNETTDKKEESPAAKWLKHHKKETGIAAGCCAALLALVLGVGAMGGTKPAEPTPSVPAASSQESGPSGIRVEDGSVVSPEKQEGPASSSAPAASAAAEPAPEPEQTDQGEADKKAQEEADRKAKEEADRKAKEEADRKAKEEADRKAKEEADKKAKEETYVTNRTQKNSLGETYTYTGEWKNGKPNGQGTGVFTEEGAAGTYTGHWKDGDADGYGICEWVSGNRYEGNWKNSLANGQGVLTLADGSRYEGSLKDHKMDGQGVFTLADGSRYEGSFKDDKMDGQGVFTQADGSRYEGQWKDGKMDGQGVLTQADGFRYEGSFKDHKMDGQGVLTLASGSRYEGSFKDDKMDGQGVLTLADGSRYEGQWKDNKKDGQGVLTLASGSRYEGQWKDNKKDGYGIYTYASGSRYEGDWKNDKRDGQGTYSWPGGARYEGSFKNGSMEGYGIYTWPNGNRYEGNFQNNVKNGEGVMYHADSGMKVSGIWKDDELVEESRRITIIA